MWVLKVRGARCGVQTLCSSERSFGCILNSLTTVGRCHWWGLCEIVSQPRLLTSTWTFSPSPGLRSYSANFQFCVFFSLIRGSSMQLFIQCVPGQSEIRYHHLGSEPEPTLTLLFQFLLVLMHLLGEHHVNPTSACASVCCSLILSPYIGPPSPSRPPPPPFSSSGRHSCVCVYECFLVYSFCLFICCFFYIPHMSKVIQFVLFSI